MKDQPFEGDNLIWEEIQKLITEWDVRVIIETGTEHGATARKLARTPSMLPVFTIETDLEKYNQEWIDLLKFGVVPLYGISFAFIPALVTSFPTHYRFLFYLDAHGESGSPIREELTMIRKACVSPPVIVVHDCKVPGSEFGYDIYSNGTELSLDYFKDLLTWPHNLYYNAQAEGARRGVLYITP